MILIVSVIAQNRTVGADVQDLANESAYGKRVIDSSRCGLLDIELELRVVAALETVADSINHFVLADESGVGFVNKLSIGA